MHKWLNRLKLNLELKLINLNSLLKLANIINEIMIANDCICLLKLLLIAMNKINHTLDGISKILL